MDPLHRLLALTKMEPSGCIAKTSDAGCDKYGYWRFNFNGKTSKAHRVSYQLQVGPIPHGLCVLHKCDNPRCINPDHLWLGTFADNNKDRDAKGRTRFAHIPGERNSQAKISDADALRIREMANAGKTTAEIRESFPNLSKSAIGCIVRGETWTHLPTGKPITRKRTADIRSAHKGVAYHKATGKWVAYHNKRHLGLFSSQEEAYRARLQAEAA